MSFEAVESNTDKAMEWHGPLPGYADADTLPAIDSLFFAEVTESRIWLEAF